MAWCNRRVHVLRRAAQGGSAGAELPDGNEPLVDVSKLDSKARKASKANANQKKAEARVEKARLAAKKAQEIAAKKAEAAEKAKARAAKARNNYRKQQAKAVAKARAMSSALHNPTGPRKKTAKWAVVQINAWRKVLFAPCCNCQKASRSILLHCHNCGDNGEELDI